MMTEDDLTALNEGLIGAVHISAQQVRVDTDHAISLIAMARDSLDLRAQLAAMTAERDALVSQAKAEGRKEGVEEYWRLTFNGMSPHEAKRTVLAAAQKEVGK